jgi:predicted NAD-dependent protein-ADP-ribosyltransferase YbiA (DUF1768 family)
MAAINRQEKAIGCWCTWARTRMRMDGAAYAAAERHVEAVKVTVQLGVEIRDRCTQTNNGETPLQASAHGAGGE